MGKSLSIIAISIQVYCMGCSHHNQFRKRQLLMKQTKNPSEPFATDVLSHITNFLEPHNAVSLQLSHKRANDAVKKGQNLKIFQDEIHQQILKLNRLKTIDFSRKLNEPNLLNDYDKDLKQLLINVRLSDEFMRETPNIIEMLYGLYLARGRKERMENLNEIHKILFGFGLKNTARQDIENRFNNKQEGIFKKYDYAHTKLLSIISQEIKAIIRGSDMDSPKMNAFKQFYGFIFEHCKNVITTETELPALKDIGYLRFNQDSKLRQDQWILVNDLVDEFGIIFYHDSFIHEKLPEKINILEYIITSSHDYDELKDEFQTLEKIMVSFGAHWSKTILDHHDGRQYDIYKMYYDDQVLDDDNIKQLNGLAISLQVMGYYQALFKYLEIFRGFKTFRPEFANYQPTGLDLYKLSSNVQWIFQEFRDKDCIKMLELMIEWNSVKIMKPTSIKYIARWLIGKFATNEKDKKSYDVYGNSKYIANMLYHKKDVLQHDENIINELDHINNEFKFCDDEQIQKQFFDELKNELVKLMNLFQSR